MEVTKDIEELLLHDFESVPVDILTFITDPYYLGKTWTAQGGKLMAWDSWLKAALDVFPLPMRSPYNSVLLLGATGIGKTSFAVNMLMAYYLYLVLLLKRPHEYFDLAEQKNIFFAFINIVTKTIAYKNAWGMFHKALLQSPFFMERGMATTGRRPEWYCTTKPVELLYGNDASQIIGLDLLAVFMDEVSFARVRDIQKAQERAADVFNAALERMTSRFTKFGGIFEGLMIMASSKRTDQAFAEVFAKKLKEGPSGKRVYIVDKPRWEMLPQGTYSGKTFTIAIGDKYRPSQIISPSDETTYRNAGYTIIYPPIETLAEFDRDLQSALTNIAGISVQYSATFLRGDLVVKNIDDTRKNPFMQNPIFVGQKDAVQYFDFFDLSCVSQEDRNKPLYIHLDASLGSDGTTFAGVVIDSADVAVDREGNSIQELTLKHLFSVKVKAPKGDRVMLRKNEQFIFWLRSQGFNIALVSSDQFQSEQFSQDIMAEGIKYKRQSIDRVLNGVNQPYLTLQNVLYDNRINLLRDADLLDELVHLEKYADGRVDKPSGGTDDASQALCGAVFGAMQDKEAYMSSSSLNLIMSSFGHGDTYTEKSIEFNMENMSVMDLSAAIQNSMREQFDKPILPLGQHGESTTKGDDFGLIFF